MTARGWRVGFPNSLVIAQITLSFAQFCLSLSQVDFFCVPWHETFRQSFYTKSCTQKVSYFIKNNPLIRFTLSDLISYFHFWYFISS